jgi:hypothetical protein
MVIGCNTTRFCRKNARRLEGGKVPGKLDTNVFHQERVELVIHERIDLENSIAKILAFFSNAVDKIFHSKCGSFLPLDGFGPCFKRYAQSVLSLRALPALFAGASSILAPLRSLF